MSGTNITIYPTLVIGLGGTGTSAVRYVKRRFLRTWNADHLEDLPSVLQVLAVDTEPLVNRPEDEQLYFHEFAFMGKFDATRLVQYQHNHQPHLNWWRWNQEDIPLGYIHSGAKQLRPIGRLAFFRNYITFKNMLKDKLQAMGGPIEEAQERGFNVVTNYRLIYIVSSLCGGTGSGMFMDVAHCVRHYVGSSASIIGIFMLPSIFETEIRSDLQRRRIKANTYAAMKELNYFHTHQSFRAHYPGEQVPIPTTQHRAFNQVFLLDRTNASGRALSSKAAAEQMAAHMIHLTAFSHLNTRILGLDVNITEERTATVQGVMQTYLSYSSFGVSALVMPREALWRYFLHMTVSWAMAYLIPEQTDPAADQVFWTTYLSLRDDLKKEFQKHAENDKNLKRLRDDLVHSGGAWWSFARLVLSSIERLFKDYGQAGGLYVLRRLILEASEASREDLAHPLQRPFKEPRPARPVRWWERPFRSSEEIRLSVEASLEQRLFQMRAEVWQELLDALRRLARLWEEQIMALSREAQQAQEESMHDAERAAQQIHPLRRNGDRETSTYYDLETGAVGPEQLDAYLEGVLNLLDAPLSDDDPRSRWQVLLHALYDRLFVAEDDTLVSERYAHKSGLRQLVHEELMNHPDLVILRDEVRQSFDLRNVVYVQHSDGSLQPNDRIAQVLQRLAPHALVDGDTYHYSEADQESIRLIGTPSEAGEEASDVGRVFRQRLRGFSQYEWVKTGDGDRLDACYILHGLPLGQLSSMPDMFWEYHGDAFLKRALHLQPEWEQLDEIYEPPTEQHTQGQTSLSGADRPSGSLPQPPGSLPRPAHELPDAGDHDAAE